MPPPSQNILYSSKKQILSSQPYVTFCLSNAFVFGTPEDKFCGTFENIVGKGENAGNQRFLLFTQCFLPFPYQISIVYLHLFCCLQLLLNLDQSKILSFGKELGKSFFFGSAGG